MRVEFVCLLILFCRFAVRQPTYPAQALGLFYSRIHSHFHCSDMRLCERVLVDLTGTHRQYVCVCASLLSAQTNKNKNKRSSQTSSANERASERTQILRFGVTFILHGVKVIYLLFGRRRRRRRRRLRKNSDWERHITCTENDKCMKVCCTLTRINPTKKRI